MRHLNLITSFFKASAQEDMAYRSNFWIHILHTLLNTVTGALGLWILFQQIQTLHGWNFASALAILGVYLTLDAIRHLVIGPSFEALAGMGQEVWSGNFDFTLLRPVDTQFLVSFRHWNVFAFFDLSLGIGVIIAAALQSGNALDILQIIIFLVVLLCGLLALYAILLIFTGFVFWSSAFTFAWVFDAIFQMARYPVKLYPGWLRLVLTWVIPVGLMTTLPAQALMGTLSWDLLLVSLIVSIVLLLLASTLFHHALHRYNSASS